MKIFKLLHAIIFKISDACTLANLHVQCKKCPFLLGMLLKAGTGNGERGTGNGERLVTSVQRFSA